MIAIAKLTLAYCCIAPLLLPNCENNDEGQDPKGVFQFLLKYDQYSLFHIISLGDGKSQTAFLTVFEVVGEEEVQIRRLHEMELVNLCMPIEHILCGAGRFFLTFDEGYLFRDVRTTKNMLVVYDLVRKERTVYTFDDLFSEKVLKQQYLSDAESIAPRDWRQGIGKAEQHYDPNLLTFRIPLPEPIDPILLTFPDPMPEPSTEVPVFHEIVVDLPTRIAKIQQAKEYVSIDDTKVQDPALQYPNNYIEESQGMEQPSRMPQFLRLVNFRKHDQIVFEYDSNTREYCKVAVEKWQGGATSGLRCGSYTD